MRYVCQRSIKAEVAMHRNWKTCLLLGALFLSGRSGALAEPSPDAPAPAEQATPLEDPVESLHPVHPRSGRDTDRIRALALFAAGRVAEQKQDYPRALRDYERAFRFDPDALAALREIVPLAFNLDRQAEAVRYALIMAEHEPADPVLLRRLAIYLTEEGETERALKLYEKALSLSLAAAEKPTANVVLLWMEMGRLYFVARQYDQAAHYFAEVSKALDSPKEFGVEPDVQKALLNKVELTYQLFGEGFLEAGRPGDALAAFEKSNAAKADEALHIYNLARVDARQHQPAQALAKLETYCEKHFSSQGTGPYQAMADALGEIGQQDGLTARLEKFHAADPDNVPLAYFLAQRYRQAGQLDKAEPIYSGLLEHRKERPPLEAYQGLLEIYRQQKDAAKLLVTMGDAVGRTGTLAPLGDAGKAVVNDAELSAAVVAAARRQLESEPDKVPYGQRLAAGFMAIERKDFAAANTFFDLALKAEKAKPSEALVAWGLELFMANQYAEAIKVFQRGLQENVLPQNNPTLHFYLAGALEMSGSTDEAIEAARKATELQKDSPRFESRIAWIQYHGKRHEAARQSYLALLEKFDKTYDSPEVREVMRDARLVLSNICVLDGKMAESEEWLEQVLDEFPEDTGALNDLGYLWADAGKHLQRAMQMIRVAVAHEPKNMAYRDSLGWVLFRLGRYPEAIAELKVAAAVDEPDGLILDHLAEAQLQAGDAPAAVESWNRAAESFEKHSDAEKVKQTREKIARAQTAPVAK
jgi:tetratricopeptide (TPR) repeat protein